MSTDDPQGENKSGNKKRFPGLEGPLYRDYGEELDRIEALWVDDDKLRSAEYLKPDPARRRLRVACNDCTTPFCCYPMVSLDLVEALVVYRWAAKHAPGLLEAAVKRGKALVEEQKQTIARLSGRRVRGVEKAKLIDDVEYFKRRIPCAFLHNGKCGIYAVRPYSCRTHYMGANPQKCRDELSPHETYSMDPDPTIIAAARKLSEDIRFFAQIEEVVPHEFSQVLYLIERIKDLPPTRKPRVLEFPELILDDEMSG